MTIASPQALTLEQFLQLPYIEESPAWEFIHGEAIKSLAIFCIASVIKDRWAG